MSRPRTAVLLLALVAACSGTPAGPTPTPSPSSTATASASPSAPAVSSPTPSTTVVNTPTPTATQSGTVDFGADTLLFEDDFSADDEGWQTGTESWGSVAIASGVLGFALTQQSFLALLVGPIDDQTWDVMRV